MRGNYIPKWPETTVGSVGHAPNETQTADRPPGGRARHQVVGVIMLRFCRAKHRLTTLEKPRPTERCDITPAAFCELIASNPEAFCAEIGGTLFILGTNIRSSICQGEYIGVLAVDRCGSAVIIHVIDENDDHAHALIHSLVLAERIAKWEWEELMYLAGDRKPDLVRFLGHSINILNRYQRVMLFYRSPFFDIDRRVEKNKNFEIRDAAAWLLSHRVGAAYLGFDCLRDPNTQREYLVIGEIDRVHVPQWWPARPPKRDSRAVGEFFDPYNRDHKGREFRRDVRWDEKIRFRATRRRLFALINQIGRFADDCEFWRARLSAPDSVTVVRGGRGLSFRLYTPEDFHRLDVSWEDYEKGNAEALL